MPFFFSCHFCDIRYWGQATSCHPEISLPEPAWFSVQSCDQVERMGGGGNTSQVSLDWILRMEIHSFHPRFRIGSMDPWLSLFPSPYQPQSIEYLPFLRRLLDVQDWTKSTSTKTEQGVEACQSPSGSAGVSEVASLPYVPSSTLPNSTSSYYSRCLPPSFIG